MSNDEKKELRELIREVMFEVAPISSTVTIAQAAAMLGVSNSHVRDLINEGFLETKYVGNKQVRPIRVTVSSIKEL